MLELLRIRNLALIEDLELEFAPGLNVLTGETGAGKSFILRALGFLTGERLDASYVRPGAEKAEAEALFALPEEDLVIRRELAGASGRSRLYINDKLSSIERLAELRQRLFEHTSQHAQQRLLSPAYQARVIDRFLPDPGLLTRREELLDRLQGVAARRGELARRVEELSRQREFLEYQQAEIAKVKPQPGEEDELLERRRLAREAAGAVQAGETALELLAGEEPLPGRLAGLARSLEGLARLDPDLEAEREWVEEARHRLADLEPRLRRALRAVGSEDDTEAMESRLFALAQLRRKLDRSLNEILELDQEIAENLSFLDGAALDLARLEREQGALVEELSGLLTELGEARRQAGERLGELLVRELSHLGFSEHLQVLTGFSEREVFPGLSEKVGRILWVPNPGQPPQELERIASGGELSRFTLALTRLLAGEELGTLIFDEIDTGIGGMTLGRVADRLAGLAEERQVICITHWPQLAARARRHFKVAKEVEDGQTFTRCLRLEEDELEAELARMAGGGEEGRALAQGLRQHKGAPKTSGSAGSRQGSLLGAEPAGGE